MANRRLKRSLGLAGVSFYGIGLILGAGIYSILGSAAGAAGEALWMSFLLGSMAAFLTGLSYAELGAMLPKAGAEYVYAAEAWPSARWLRAVLGFTLAAAGTATAATVSLSFGGYAQLFLPVPELLVAVGLIAAVAALNVVGLEEASWINAAFTLIEAVGLIAVIAVGVLDPDFGQAILAAPHGGVMTGASLVFFAYLGFEDIANLAEETRDPGRNIPRAIIISVIVSTLLYVLVSVASVALIDPDTLARSSSPLADAVREGAPRLAGVLGAVALFATANTALIALLAASRILYGMSTGGDMPAALGRVLARRGTPWVAVVCVAVGGALMLPLGSIDLVGSVASLAALIAFAAVNACLIRLRFKQPRAERPFRVPFSVAGFAVVPIAGALLAVLLMTQFDAVVYPLVLGVLVGGLVVHLLVVKAV